MSRKKIISNEEFDVAWGNTDIQAIIKFAYKTFYYSLDNDVLIQCGRIGLWHTLEYHNPNKSKFLTNLTKWVRWECLKSIREEEKEKGKKNVKNMEGLIVKEVISHDEIIDLNNLINKLNKGDRSLIQYRYFDRMDYREIGRKINFSYETARTRVRQAIEGLREIVGKEN